MSHTVALARGDAGAAIDAGAGPQIPIWIRPCPSPDHAKGLKEDCVIHVIASASIMASIPNRNQTEMEPNRRVIFSNSIYTCYGV